MTAGLARDERGQTLVVVALAATALLGAAALAVDFGYGYVQRRILQNAADAAALGAARLLAEAAVVVLNADGVNEVRFSTDRASDGLVWSRANTLASANFVGAASGAAFTLSYGTAQEPLVWTASDGAASSAREVPKDTVHVRVRASVRYASLLAAALGTRQIEAAASARARLVGAAPPSGAVWSIAHPFDPAEFFSSAGAAGSDPQPVTFWSSKGHVDFEHFNGLVDYSRNSHNVTLATQLIADWDRSGSPLALTAPKPDTSGKPDASGKCPLGLWDTAGGEDPNKENRECSVPNWAFYGFGGRLSLSTSYEGVAPPQEPPTLLTPANDGWCGSAAAFEATWRARCNCAFPPPALRATCDGARSTGDWVETVRRKKDRDVTDNMAERIRAGGITTPLSSRVVASGPNAGKPYGKALVVLVYLWDCAESFDEKNAVGSQYDLILPKSGPADCSLLEPKNTPETPARVHLFTVLPFTFYENLVSSTKIEGFWGGAWGATLPAGEPTGPGPFANTAILVPDR